MNPKVNWFFDKDSPWKDSYEKLRTIVLGCGLTEEPGSGAARAIRSTGRTWS